MAEQCDGRRVGLFSQEDMAPADASLAGIPLGASARAKTRCEGETVELQLLMEDQRVSPLGSGTAHLCATCAARGSFRCAARVASPHADVHMHVAAAPTSVARTMP